MSCNISFFDEPIDLNDLDDLDGDLFDSYQLATNSGAAALCEWATSIGQESYPELDHLLRFGWVVGMDKLEEQLRRAIRDTSPKANIKKTALDLLDHLVGREPGGMAIIGDLG